MPGPPLAKSRPKSELMTRLNLTGDGGEKIYILLYEEAVVGRKNLSKEPNALTEYSRNKRVQQPYRWDDLQETYRHRERLSIVARAKPELRRYYDEGQYGTTVVDNWVADWFLWHSFRFRDNRPPAEQTGPVTPTNASSAGGTPSAGYWNTILHRER